MRWRAVLGNLASGAAALLAAIVALILAMDLLGDPAVYQLPMEADAAARAAFRAEHGLDRPLAMRAASRLAALATGALGESQWLRRPVAAVVMEHLPGKSSRGTGTGVPPISTRARATACSTRPRRRRGAR